MAAGDVDGARRTISEMIAQDPPAWPDQRTVNTFLRGCLKLGEVQAACEFFGRLEEWEVAADSATYKIMMQVLGMGWKLKDMQALLQDLSSRIAESKSGDAIEGLDNEVGLNLSVAQVAYLIGKPKTGKQALLAAEAALARGPHERLGFSEATGGAKQFDQHRRRELAREADRLRSAVESGGGASFDLAGCLGRSFAFPALRGSVRSSNEDNLSASESWKPVLDALRGSFGVDKCFDLGLCSKEDFEAQLKRCFSPKGTLRWPRVFGGKGLPTRLEICSGTGDWAVAQARAEAGRANWIASELRFDRAHAILAKTVLARVGNLAVFAGDAALAVRCRVPPSSLANVCINFPEPPQTDRNASCDEAESQLHLLTADFFRDAHVALVDGGILTIFSDNEQYMQSLARTLGSLREQGGPGRLFTPFGDVPDEHVMEAQEICGVLLYQGQPGPEVGHAVAQDSYFDRLFQLGQHSERYYIAVVKS
ncbi:unnamed protein product [Polarella glacialis]|uniref:tRNA (guanine(46)-N(7))-methyltransferase n=1 Tax=Polarella glacialis TaxID=89957 RepID=A0A813FAE2_POLGL|nr:unnamed protein product [Polarella glacialis]